MPFKDYTLREKEIHQSMCRVLDDKATDAEEMRRWKLRLPKRLRGVTVAMIDRLRTLNHRCSYTELLRHYCPVKVCIVPFVGDLSLILADSAIVFKARVEEEPCPSGGYYDFRHPGRN